MERQRLILIAVFFLAILGLVGWLGFKENRKSASTFVSGAPPKALNEIVVKANIPLSQLRPPALRIMDHVRYGGASSSASVILFGTYRCQECKEIEAAIKDVLPKYHGMVRYVWRDLPAADDQQALNDIIFAFCADLQGKYWETHDALMAAPNLDAMTYSQIANALKLDAEILTRCRYDKSVAASIMRDAEIAGGDGVTSTPLLFIGTEAINQVLPAEELERKLKLFLSS
jgi:protein-disulfide isomerase